MQFKALEPGIEVNGQTVYSIVDGFGTFAMLAGSYLLAAGIGERAPDGSVKVALDKWYPQQAWLGAFERIARDIGEMALFNIGKRIPLNAKFPPWVRDVDSAIRSIDVAYHLNHRKQGKVMFDLETGKLTQGIGNYGYERTPGKNRIVSRCNNPYPCAFDRGIITTMATQFAPQARAVHDDTQPCRTKGADSCTFVVTW